MARTDSRPTRWARAPGSVTAFSNADGFITIDQHTEILDSGSTVQVQLLGQKVEPADLVIIGSHCVGLDYLVGVLQRKGLRAKSMYVGAWAAWRPRNEANATSPASISWTLETGEYNAIC